MPETCKPCGEQFDPPDSIGSDSSLCQMRWESDCSRRWHDHMEAMNMAELTEKRLAELAASPPPEVDRAYWDETMVELRWNTSVADAYVLNLMLADLDARTAKAREVSSGERPPVESRRSIDTRDGRWVEVPVPGKTVLVRASNLPSTLAETREGANVRIEYAVLDDDGGDEVAEQKPFNMNISEEWLKKMADAEGSGFTSVGGLAVELGLPVAKPAPDLLRAYIRRNPHPECLPSMLFRATMPGGGNTWHATYEAAADAILEAVGKAVGDE